MTDLDRRHEDVDLQCLDNKSIKVSDIYRDAVSTRNVELQALWSRFNLYLGLNGVFLAAFLNVRTDTFFGNNKWFGIIFGILLVIMWWRAEYFGRWALKWRDRKVGEVESLWPKELRDKLELYRNMPKERLRQQYNSQIVILLFAAAWGWILISHVWFASSN